MVFFAGRIARCSGEGTASGGAAIGACASAHADSSGSISAFVSLAEQGVTVTVTVVPTTRRNAVTHCYIFRRRGETRDHYADQCPLIAKDRA